MGFIDALTSIATPRCVDDCDEWCIGLPLQSIRMLDNGELEQLRESVNSQFAWQQAVSISSAFVFAGLYIASILFPGPATFWPTVGAASFMGVFVVWLFTDNDSWLRRYRTLQMDLASAVVHTFRNDECDEPLEVLPRSEIVFRSNNLSPKKWSRAPIIAVAKTPAIALMALDWLQPVDGSIGRFFSGKRALSVAEREEIRRWASQVLDERRKHAVNYVCWAVLVAWLSRWGNPELFYAALAITGYTSSRIYSELLTVVALKRDADGGTVVINRRAAIYGGKLTPVGTPSEFLPQAKLKWTDDGDAAEWRRLSS